MTTDIRIDKREYALTGDVHLFVTQRATECGHAVSVPLAQWGCKQESRKYCTHCSAERLAKVVGHGVADALFVSAAGLL